MNFILFDDSIIRTNLLPFTFTRPIADIRIGILTLREKWEKILAAKTSSKTVDYLSKKYATGFLTDGNNLWINGSVIPTTALVKEIKQLQPKQVLFFNDTIVCINTGDNKTFPADVATDSSFTKMNTKQEIDQLIFPWDIFSKNDAALKADFQLLTAGRKSAFISNSNQVMNPDNIFLEEGASVEFSILNATAGPIYIGKDAEVMEGCMIRGSFSLGKHATLKMGTKIYGATTIGPECKVGGEVNNSVIFGYSNKAHDGFLGNSVIGEWCNLGADTNNSNLKNNYGTVNMWHYGRKDFISSGLTFCGLMMGDHSKCGINTMFNTGTVVGVNANIFGAGFPLTHVPSFSWGGATGYTTYKLENAFEVATRVFERRGLTFNEQEKAILTHIFESTKK